MFHEAQGTTFRFIFLKVSFEQVVKRGEEKQQSSTTSVVGRWSGSTHRVVLWERPPGVHAWKDAGPRIWTVSIAV